MAGKQQQQLIPAPTGGGKFLPKLISTLVLLAVLALVIKHPTDAANMVTALWAAGASAVDGLATFFQAVGSK